MTFSGYLLTASARALSCGVAAMARDRAPTKVDYGLRGPRSRPAGHVRRDPCGRPTGLVRRVSGSQAGGRARSADFDIIAIRIPR